MKIRFLALAAVILSACASYSGSSLEPGTDTLDTVIRVMGEPAMRWQDADGSIQLSYPRGPSSPESFMVKLGKDGKLQSIKNVLVPEVTRQISAGMTKDEVLRLIGPPENGWTIYFKARDELVWDWRYQESSELAHFVVLFDATRGTVRSSMVIIDIKPPTPF